MSKIMMHHLKVGCLISSGQTPNVMNVKKRLHINHSAQWTAHSTFLVFFSWGTTGKSLFYEERNVFDMVIRPPDTTASVLRIFVCLQEIPTGHLEMRE